MRADERALVALYALLCIPLRNGDGDAALLICGCAQLEGAVGVIDEGGDGQCVAVHLVDGIEDGADHLDGLLAAGLFDGGLVILCGLPGLGEAVAPASMAA